MGPARPEWRSLLVGTIVVLLSLAVVVGALGADAGGVGGADRGATAADGDAPAATLGPPDWPREPLDPEAIPGRHDVEDTTEYPYATIGHVGASGVLVSDYHVLTAAHVVSHDDGTPKAPENLTFTPGLRVTPDGPVEAPFGRANVEAVYVHPAWEGEAPEHDLALLVLDRPVGAVAGLMALPEEGVTDAHQRDLQQAGYVNNVTGARQLTAEPVPQQAAAEREARGDPDDGYHYYCAPVSRGDSGSPVWTEVDGTPTVVSVNAAFDAPSECDDAAVGVLLNDSRLDLVRDWMAQSERPATGADLVVASNASGATWVQGDDRVPGVVEPTGGDPTGDEAGDGTAGEHTADRQPTFGTTIYNNGPATVGTTADRNRVDDRATVRFLGVGTTEADGDGTEHDDGGDARVVTELCSTRTVVGPYEAVDVECERDGLPAPLRDASTIDVYATVSAGHVATYERTPAPLSSGPQFVGTAVVNRSAT